MRLSVAFQNPTPLTRQFNVSALTVPPGWKARRTSTLLDAGLLAANAGPGLIAYTALGTRLLDRIETDCVQALADLGHDLIRLPHIMSDKDLATGEEVGEQFARKLVKLADPFATSHLMTSPETLFARLAQQFQLSHKGMPLKLAYRTSIFRNMPETRSFLTCNEFRVVGAIAMFPKETSVDGVSAAVCQVADAFSKVAAAWGVPTVQVGKPGINELGYTAVEGDVQTALHGEQQRVLSLSIGYPYGKDIDFPVSYRTPTNELDHPRVMTIAMCTNRLLYSAFDATRDDLGFALTPISRPFDIAIVPRSGNDIGSAVTIANTLAHNGLRVALDDRIIRKVSARLEFASYLGIPATLVVHRDLGLVTPRGSQADYETAKPLSEAMPLS